MLTRWLHLRVGGGHTGARLTSLTERPTDAGPHILLRDSADTMADGEDQRLHWCYCADCGREGRQIGYWAKRRLNLDRCSHMPRYPLCMPNNGQGEGTGSTTGGRC